MTKDMEGDMYNSSKLAFHPEKLRALAEGRVTSPIYVRIKPTNKCNHHCFYCSYDPALGYILSDEKHSGDNIPLSKMTEILENFEEMGVKAVTFSGGGEPLAYTHIVRAFRETLNRGIDLSIITNGQLLTSEKKELLTEAEWVRISADYLDAKTFATIRRVPESLFYKVRKNIIDFAKKKKSECELGINFIVNHHNANKLEEATRFFRDIGADHIRFSPVYIPENHGLGKNSTEYHNQFRKEAQEGIARAFELASEKFKVFSFYDHDFNSAMVSERPYKRCFMMEVVPVIAANQSVYFCHDKAYSKRGLLGSIKERSFKDLWFSEYAKKIFREFDPVKGCRHHCTADGRNLAMTAMVTDLENIAIHTPHTERHKNFI